jgi:hypothetical protein
MIGNSDCRRVVICKEMLHNGIQEGKSSSENNPLTGLISPCWWQNLQGGEDSLNFKLCKFLSGSGGGDKTLRLRLI